MANAETEQLRAWLSLLHVPGLGPRGLGRLLERFADPRAILAAGRGGWREAGLGDGVCQALASPDAAAVERDLAWLERPGNFLLSLVDPRYPPLLREIPDPPPLLFVHGDPAVLAEPQLAIVGSRNPTAGGRDTSREFARHLAAVGLTITSGLALGIDAAAHAGALEAGGCSVAVFGTGLDRVYPASHRGLAHRLAEAGALVSEFPPGSGPRPDHFPRRNRIISGLSLGTLVVEAALRSGSLTTARHASEQGREVFAIPGSIHNPLARGCHRLIRDGAKLVETATDVLEELGALAEIPLATAEAAAAASPQLEPEYLALLDQLGYDPVTVDTLVGRSGLTPEVLSSMLLLLELRGHVTALPGGRYLRARHETPR